MADIHFTNTQKKKFKSPTVGDLKRSPTVALAVPLMYKHLNQ